MVSRVTTVAFQGVDARPVDVQVHITPGLVGFSIVGLPDKAVAESRERVRSALVASGMAMPAKRITVNLAPADLPKEGRGHRFESCRVRHDFNSLSRWPLFRT
jgi:magnesium chelatase family protein